MSSTDSLGRPVPVSDSAGTSVVGDRGSGLAPPALDVHPDLVRPFAALDAAGVRWCLLHLATDLVSPDGDIDLLVDPSDLRAAAAALEREGFAPLPFASPGGAGYLRYDAASDRWLWLDLETRLPAGTGREGGSEARVAQVTQQVLAARRKAGPAWVPAPNDEPWLLLLHRLANGRPIEERHRARLRVAARGADSSSPVASVLAQVTGTDRPDVVIGLVRRERWDDVASLPPVAGPAANPRRFHPRGRIAAFLAAALRGVRHPRALPSPRALRRRMGLGVALLGPDGAGKSSTAHALVEQFPFGGRQVYMGMRGNLTSPEPGYRYLPAISPLLGIALQWGSWLLAIAHMLRGRLVIFDRYTEDPYLPPPPGERLPKRLGRAVRRLLACPPPDLAIVLDAPGEVMYARKGEHSPERLERERQRYLALRGRMPNVVVVDATQSPEAVRRAATVLLWRRYARRLHGSSAAPAPARTLDERPGALQ